MEAQADEPHPPANTIFDRILTINGVDITCRALDTKINLTELCKAGNKYYKNWFQNERSKKFINMLSASVGKPADQLIVYESGSIYERATWGVPQVAINIAQWLSSELEVKVSNWIYELGATGTVSLGNEKSIEEIESVFKSQIENMNNELETKNNIINDLQNEITDYDTIHFQEIETKNIEHISESNIFTNDTLTKLSLLNVIYILSTNISKDVIYNGKIYKVNLTSFGMSQNIKSRLCTHKKNYPDYKILMLCVVSNSRAAELRIKKYLFKNNLLHTNIRKNGKPDVELFHTTPENNINKVLSNIKSICLELTAVGFSDVANAKIEELEKQNTELKHKLDVKNNNELELTAKNSRLSVIEKQNEELKHKLDQKDGIDVKLKKVCADLVKANETIIKLNKTISEIHEEGKERTCDQCNKVKLLIKFPRRKDTGKYRKVCIKCHDKNKREASSSDLASKIRENVELGKSGLKKCWTCNEVKNKEDDFYESGPSGTCKDCTKKQEQERRDKAPASDRAKITRLNNELKKEGKKKCRNCEETKSVDDFYNGNFCKECDKKKIEIARQRRLAKGSLSFETQSTVET